MCVCILALSGRQVVYFLRRGLNHIFSHYLINGTIFGKYLLNIKYVLILSTSLKSFSF